MKNMVVISFTLVLAVFAASPISSANSLGMMTYENDSNSKIDGIQERIYNAFYKSMQNKSVKPIDNIINELKQYPQNNVVIYWQAYAQFYKSIFYLQYNNPPKMKEETNKGIEILETLENKDCEIYALLSRLQGISMQYAGMKAMFVFKQMNDNSEKALKLCPNNLRANFVAASNDFYTPTQFGGGNKVEKLLLKAISLPEQEVVNNLLPSWGKDEAYELLIRVYISRGEIKKASALYDKAISIYPDNFMIKQLRQYLNSN